MAPDFGDLPWEEDMHLADMCPESQDDIWVDAYDDIEYLLNSEEEE